MWRILFSKSNTSIGLGEVKLTNKDRNLAPRLQWKNGERMGRKRQQRKGGSRTEELRRTFVAAISAHRQSKISRKKTPASGKPVGRCEAVERNRRRFHGIVEEFRVSQVQNEQQTSKKSSVLPITPEGPNDSARARWSATRRKSAFRRCQLREWEQSHGQQ